MIACRRGDIVLVRFVFADESGWKTRPALVLNSPQYQRSRQEVVVAAVTSNVARLLYGDHLVRGWKEAGLLFPSVVTGILRTVKQEMVHRRLGALPEADMTAVNTLLRKTLALQKD
jgi:mRNA-degrading endonuclease toxin of MazEF toxin-antitoxin module